MTVVLTLACAAPAAAEPLRLDGFFQGRLTGSGTVDNWREGTHRTFTATMQADWSGPQGTLVEDLVYADGERRHIVWRFEKAGAGYVGHRDDLVGDATVVQDGDALRMTYTARTKVPSGSTWNLDFDDRLERTSPDTVAMTGRVSYLFVGVGATAMTIRRTGP